MGASNPPNLITGRDIVMISHQSWDDGSMGSNCRDVARQFEANNNRVLYVNAALSRLDLWHTSKDPMVINRKKVLQGELPPLRRIKPSFWNLDPKTFMEPVNRLRPAFVFNAVNYMNNNRLANEISSAIKTLGFKEYILFNDMEMYRGFYLKTLLKPETYLYYLRDNLIFTKYFRTNGTRLEPRLIAESDLVVCNSIYLRDYALRYNRQSYYVGQGCDVDLFDSSLPWAKPQELQTLHGPAIGYVGALLASRLDISLLTKLALTNLSWNFIFVGPEDEAFRRSDLRQLPNVYFMGRKPPEDLPLWIAQFDVCINPQWVNEFTLGNYPRKADEYLAMGKPVVARHTQAMDSFAAVCYLAEDADSFEQAIRRALDEDAEPLRLQRRAFALQHSWENHYLAVSEAYYEYKNPRDWKPKF